MKFGVYSKLLILEIMEQITPRFDAEKPRRWKQYMVDSASQW